MFQVSKPSLIIRRATVADAALLAELGARTFFDTFAADNTPEDIEAYVAKSFGLAQQEAELIDPHAAFFIAEVEGAAAGYAKLRAGDAPPNVTGTKPIEIVRLYVLREWFGRGVGEALMRRSVEEAQAGGHDKLWLGVWERNERAQAFYRKWHFREVGEHIFQLGSDAQRDVLMERAI